MVDLADVRPGEERDRQRAIAKQRELDSFNARRKKERKGALTLQQFERRRSLIRSCNYNVTELLCFSPGIVPPAYLEQFHRDYAEEKLAALELPELEMRDRVLEQKVKEYDQLEKKKAETAYQQAISLLHKLIDAVYPQMAQTLGQEKARLWRASVSDEYLVQLGRDGRHELTQKLLAYLDRQQPQKAIWDEFERRSGL